MLGFRRPGHTFKSFQTFVNFRSIIILHVWIFLWPQLFGLVISYGNNFMILQDFYHISLAIVTTLCPKGLFFGIISILANYFAFVT